eukprot:s5804_g2.t1
MVFQRKAKVRARATTLRRNATTVARKDILPRIVATTVQALWKDWSFGKGLLWEKNPSKKPKSTAAGPKAKAKPNPKAKGRGRGRGRSGKFREVGDGDAADEADEEGQEPEGEQGGDQVAMMVKSSGTVMSDSGKAKKATGTSSTESPEVHHT